MFCVIAQTNFIQPCLQSVCKLFYEINLSFQNHGCGFDQITVNEGARVCFHIPCTIFTTYTVTTPLRFRFLSKTLLDIFRNKKKTSFIHFLYTPPEKANDSFELEVIVRSDNGEVSSTFIRLIDDPRELYKPNPYTQKVQEKAYHCMRSMSSTSYWFPLSMFKHSLVSLRNVCDRMKPSPVTLRQSMDDRLLWEARVGRKSSFQECSHVFSIDNAKCRETQCFDYHFQDVVTAQFWPLCQLQNEMLGKICRVKFTQYPVCPSVLFEVWMDWNIMFSILFIDSKEIDTIYQHVLEPNYGTDTSTSSSKNPMVDCSSSSNMSRDSG